MSCGLGDRVRVECLKVAIMRKFVLALPLLLVAFPALAVDNYARTPYYPGQKSILTGFYPNPAVNPQTATTVAVADLIVQNQTANGFSASDPRVATTLKNGGLAVLGGVAGAIATNAPTGLGVAAGLAVGGVCLGGSLGLGSFGCGMLGFATQAAVTAAVSALLQWAMHSDGSVVAGGGSAPVYTGNQWVIYGGTAYPYNDAGAMGICVAYWSPSYSVSSASFGNGCTLAGVSNVQLNPVAYAQVVSSSTGYPIYSPPVTGTTYPNTNAAVQGLTDAQKSAPVDAATLAAIANATLQAAQNVPGSLPVVPSNPITAAQSQAEINTMGANAPTVGDLFAPVQTGQVANAGSALVPSSTLGAAALAGTLTSSATVPSADVNSGGVTAGAPPSTTVNVNLGPDPGVGSPGMETPPDGPTIMGPLVSGLAAYTGFSVALPAGVCPAPTFDFRPVWQLSVPSTVICTLYDSVTVKISLVMTLCWSVCFLLIVLRA